MNSVVVSDLLCFVYSKLYLLVKDGNEWDAMAVDGGFCSMKKKKKQVEAVQVEGTDRYPEYMISRCCLLQVEKFQ